MLSEKFLVIVPAQEDRIGSLTNRPRDDDISAVKRVIGPPVLEVLLQLLTYLGEFNNEVQL